MKLFLAIYPIPADGVRGKKWVHHWLASAYDTRQTLHFIVKLVSIRNTTCAAMDSRGAELERSAAVCSFKVFDGRACNVNTLSKFHIPLHDEWNKNVKRCGAKCEVAVCIFGVSPMHCAEMNSREWECVATWDYQQKLRKCDNTISIWGITLQWISLFLTNLEIW